LGVKRVTPKQGQAVQPETHQSLFKIRLSKLAIMLGDAGAMVLAFVMSLPLTAALVSPDGVSFMTWWKGQDAQRFIAWGLMGVLGLVLLLSRYQHYSDRRPLWDELGDFFRLVGILALMDMALVAVTRWNASRLWWLVSWVLVLLMLVLMRYVTRQILKKFSLWYRPTVIVGIGSNAEEAALALNSQPELGFLVQGFVDAGGAGGKSSDKTYPRLPALEMVQYAKQPGIQWVIALEHAQSDQREQWLRQLAQWGAPDISVIPAMRGVPLHGTDMSHFFSHEVALLRMRNNLRRWPARLTKRLFDTVAALALLLVLSPAMLLMAWAVRRDGGPALFAHPRVGKKGKVFNCYKFRTMVVDAEKQLENLLQRQPELRKQWQTERKLRSDPRVSQVGRFLRRTSLDELPQLINVIRGEMSLVGPRPVVRSELPRYGDQVGYYLMVRPGMTGLWQVSGRNDVGYGERVRMDSDYARNWSLLRDLRVLLRTPGAVLRRSGAY
jgi:Undecaprenyl-phosphate galactose phosphotransferase WbaP